MKKKFALRLIMFLFVAVIFGIGVSAGADINSQAKVKYYKISGQWVGFDKSSGKLTWGAKLSYIPKKIVGKKVKILGKWCYSGNTKIKSITIPSSVNKVEKGAFYGCKNLKKVVIPKGLKLGDISEKRLFWESNKLKTVVNNPDKKWKARIKTFNDTLDYLKKQDPQYYVDNVRSFKNQWIVDKDGKHIPYTDEAWDVVVKKAKALTKGLSSDREKAKAISKWIVKYLHYDEKWMEKFQEWRKTHDEDKEEFPIKKVTDAYGLINWEPAEHDGETAMTTCGGYGNLTQALFCAAGIPCVHVHRLQKKGEDIDHVFNVAYIGGKWIWLDNTYSDETLNYFDCQIPGFSASDHRCDRLNLVNLSELSKSSVSKVKYDSQTEYVKVGGLNWGIERSTGTITWIPRDFTGPEIPAELDGMRVTKIGSYACTYRENIRELIIPEGVTGIAEGAFRGNYRLSKLTVSSTVKKIGDYAFEACVELENIAYKGDQKKIHFGNFAFRKCYFLHPDFTKYYKNGIYYKKLNEVSLSGDMAADILSIAKSQLGYHQGNDKTQMHGYNKLGGEYYTEYNFFSGLPDWQWGMKDYVKKSNYKYGYGGWCGNFCDWCLSMAGIPKECSLYYDQKDSIKWKDTVYAGGSYNIKAGDVLHFSAGHYCLVESVSEDTDKVLIKTLNGNPDVSRKTYKLNKKNGKNLSDHNYDLTEILPLKPEEVKGVKSFKVRFDTGDSSINFSPKTVYEGGHFGLLPKPEIATLTFDGWYTEPNGGGKKITSYRNVWLDGDITVYAKWVLGDEPSYLDKSSYVSEAPTHSSINDQFAGIYLSRTRLSYGTLKKKSQKIQVKRRNGKGRITCKNVTDGSKKKYLKLGKNGAITVKKGAPKGKYSIFVTVAKYKTINMTQSTVSFTVN